MKKILLIASIVLVGAWACDTLDGSYAKEGGYSGRADGDWAESGVIDPGGDGGEGQGNGAQAGVVTAAEWNDLEHWSFWGGLMTGDYSGMNTLWGLNTSGRIAIKVQDAEGAPVVSCPVELLKDGKALWKAVTDNHGLANLWLAVEDVQSTVKASECIVSIDGVSQTAAPEKWDWTSEAPVVNTYTLEAPQTVSSIVDIAFIVDATGSMGDEIAFLKKDLHDILKQVSEMNTDRTIYTGTVFYRDEGDDYVTRPSGFTTDIASTMDFVGKQYADGGGDTPEAVHTALAVALTDLQWHSKAYTRMAFLVLDAPAHRDHKGVIESLQKSIREFASRGIRIIPVFCSSYEKDCEFMCRQFAILTGGTYVFLTNDSGVGGEHIAASVGEYQVEALNALLFRLISAGIE